MLNVFPGAVSLRSVWQSRRRVHLHRQPAGSRSAWAYCSATGKDRGAPCSHLAGCHIMIHRSLRTKVMKGRTPAEHHGGDLSCHGGGIAYPPPCLCLRLAHLVSERRKLVCAISITSRPQFCNTVERPISDHCNAHVSEARGPAQYEDGSLSVGPFELTAAMALMPSTATMWTHPV